MLDVIMIFSIVCATLLTVGVILTILAIGYFKVCSYLYDLIDNRRSK